MSLQFPNLFNRKWCGVEEKFLKSIISFEKNFQFVNLWAFRCICSDSDMGLLDHLLFRTIFIFIKVMKK